MPRLELQSKQIWQRHIVRQWKGLEPATCVREIVLRDEMYRTVGKLVPIDVARADDSATIDNLTRWRQQHMQAFLTQFTATPDRTAGWLRRYLADDSRLLFLILEAGEPIGHVGICDLKSETAEGDGLVRGESGRSPFTIFFAEAWLLRWAFLTFDLHMVRSRCLAHNRPVLKLVRLLGFEETRRERLRRETHCDETHFINDETAVDSNDELVVLELQRQTLFDTHAWLPRPLEARCA